MKKIILSLLFACSSMLVFAQDSMEEALAYQYFQQAEYEKAASLFEKLFSSTKNENYFD